MSDWLDTPLLARAAGWLFTYAVHSTVLLAAAGILARLLAAGRPALEETLWRGALAGGLLTASLPRLAPWWPAPAASAATVAMPPAVLPAAPAASTASGLATAAATWAAAAWAVAAAAFLVSLGVSWWRLHRRLAGRRTIEDGPLAAAFEELRRGAGERRRVRLTSSAALRVPVAFGFRRPEVCLPERAVAELSADELAAVLSHELAHLVRRDPAWRLLARMLAGVFFFQPLQRLAARRLERLSEYLCDDWAVTRTGRATDLAHCLAEVAGWTLERPRLFPVPGIAEGRCELERRVRRLLDRGVDRRPGPRRRLALAVTAALLAVTWLAPTWTIAAGPDPQAGSAAASDDQKAPGETDEERVLRRLEAQLRQREEALRGQEAALREQEAALRQRLELLHEHEARIRRQAEEQAEGLERQVRELEEHARQVSAEEQERAEQRQAEARELEERVRQMVAEQQDREESLAEQARELEEQALRLAEEEEQRRHDEESDDDGEGQQR